MAETPSTTEDMIRSFWDRYIQRLYESGIKPPFDRWMVVRAEQYIATHPDRRLADQGPADVNTYLAVLGRQTGLKAWQFRQAVDAIQKLFELVGVNWLGEVDWAYWRDSAQGLEATHPTVARDYLPLPGANVAGAAPDAAGEEPPGGETTLAAVRAAHGALLDQVTKTLRLRGLAIRTEQTYLHWITRFFAFLGTRDPLSQGPAAIGAFLEDLALVRKVSASTQNLALNALVFLYREVLRRENFDLGVRPCQTAAAPTHGLDSRRDRCPAGGTIRDPLADGLANVWDRDAADGVRKVARPGSGLWLCADHRAAGEGRQGSGGPATHPRDRVAPGAFAAGPGTP
jgi:hypothetical protein